MDIKTWLLTLLGLPYSLTMALIILLMFALGINPFR